MRRTLILATLAFPLMATVIPVTAGQVVYATKACELADARHMGDRAIHDFFVTVSAGVAR